LDHTQHLDRQRMEELCCLWVIDELSPKERVLLEEHLSECGSCRSLIAEYEQLYVFDFPALNAIQTEQEDSGILEASTENRMLGNVVARAQNERPGGLRLSSDELPSTPCQPSLIHRLSQNFGTVFQWGGWIAAAAICLISISGRIANRTGPISQVTNQVPSVPIRLATQNTTANDSASAAAAAYERSVKDLRQRAGDAELALTSARAAYARLDDEKASLEAQLESQKRILDDHASQVDLLSAALDQQTAKTSKLEAELRDVSSKLIEQRNEVAKLQQVAETTTVRTPTPESFAPDPDAQELFGARDLHIVDVYDVDHSGKPSRTYGRVYYVNHRLLVFYAFDLGTHERNRKAVAFQAWGFKQPNSTEPESLGLFYMDDSKLDRWVLRVSDPKLLSNIDTLFVTLEPSGGSDVPKGRRVLLASLAGPPNHP
jgi:hypothetical protein